MIKCTYCSECKPVDQGSVVLVDKENDTVWIHFMSDPDADYQIAVEDVEHLKERDQYEGSIICTLEDNRFSVCNHLWDEEDLKEIEKEAEEINKIFTEAACEGCETCCCKK